jgi:hypothetical protein
MSMSNASETGFLGLVFNNLAWAGIGDAGGLQPSAVAGAFYVRLHTADPGEAGTGSTSEVAYTGYAPVAVARSALGFTVTGNQISNTSPVQFGECTAGNATATHFSVTVGAGAASTILYRGALDAARSISAGITPSYNAGALTGTAD